MRFGREQVEVERKEGRVSAANGNEVGEGREESRKARGSEEAEERGEDKRGALGYVTEV